MEHFQQTTLSNLLTINMVFISLHIKCLIDSMIFTHEGQFLLILSPLLFSIV